MKGLRPFFEGLTSLYGNVMISVMIQPITHFLYVPFTGLGLHDGYRGDKWLKNRLQIFKRFTLPSVLNQTSQNFVLWISWRKEEEENPIVIDFINSLNSIRGLTLVNTFSGVCFWDDKYDEKIASKRLLEALRGALPVLEPHIIGEHVLMTIQPSDDMYLGQMVETMQNRFQEILSSGSDVRCVGYRDGYIANYANKEIAVYTTKTSPPFYTMMFDKETFLSPEKHYKFTGPYISHEYVKDHVKMEYLKGAGFVVGTHGANISTVWHHTYRGKILSEKERDDILIKTGTLYSDPYVVPKTWGLYARIVFNKLPFQDAMRKFYHSLPSYLKVV